MVQKSPPRGGEDPQMVSKWEKESHEATRELLKVKDRLIEVERNVSLRQNWFAVTVHSFERVNGANGSQTCFVNMFFFGLSPRMPRCRRRRWP